MWPAYPATTIARSGHAFGRRFKPASMNCRIKPIAKGPLVKAWHAAACSLVSTRPRGALARFVTDRIMGLPFVPTPGLGRLPVARLRPHAGRIEADHLGEPFKLGGLLIMQVLEPDAQVSIGTARRIA